MPTMELKTHRLKAYLTFIRERELVPCSGMDSHLA